MTYSFPTSRLASLALVSAGVFVAGSAGGSAPASANPIRLAAPDEVVSSAQIKGAPIKPVPSLAFRFPFCPL